MMALTHCIYASRAVKEFDSQQLQKLLQDARAKNARHRVSGMLLYERGSFFQVLEGDAGAVHALYTRIAQDPLHEKVTRIICEPITRRLFPDWTMGYPVVTLAELSASAGLNDFFGRGSCFSDLDSGRAQKLLRAFRAGRWRVPSTSTEPVQ